MMYSYEIKNHVANKNVSKNILTHENPSLYNKEAKIRFKIISIA